MVKAAEPLKMATVNSWVKTCAFLAVSGTFHDVVYVTVR